MGALLDTQATAGKANQLAGPGELMALAAVVLVECAVHQTSAAAVLEYLDKEPVVRALALEGLEEQVQQQGLVELMVAAAQVHIQVRQVMVA